MEIKNIYGNVIYTSDALTLKDAVVEAVAKKADLSFANLSFANLRSANLRSANLRFTDLCSADLRSADLGFTNLRFANLSSANLRSADLSSADLSSADLSFTDLSSADLRSANLRSANLRSADLRSTDLRSANLRSANLRSANLRSAKNAELDFARIQFIPTEGAFIAWKKCNNGVIVKLSIPVDAKRSHGSERKCRASHVDVLEVIGADHGISLNDARVIYRAGERVTADSFDEDRWNTCSHGIHFYLTREEAVAHV